MSEIFGSETIESNGPEDLTSKADGEKNLAADEAGMRATSSGGRLRNMD